MKDQTGHSDSVQAVPDGTVAASDAAAVSRALATVLAYHRRSKHHPAQYAAGPETLDWSAQPNPFREFEGAPQVALALGARAADATFAALHTPGAVAPQPFTLDNIAALLELSFGLSAWKSYGPDLWSVRCNPSSGNLHPTEAWLIGLGIPGLDDGVYHYRSREHRLELRCHFTEPDARPATDSSAPAQLWVGLSSVMWREAWKYGERAFRYCQLDTGHALGALRYAAAALGWQAQIESACGNRELTHLLGLDRDADYAKAEREEAECLLSLSATTAANSGVTEATLPPSVDNGAWFGRPNRLDPHPTYRWPVIDDVAQASREPAANSPPANHAAHGDAASYPARLEGSTVAAADLIRQRRSAQRFDARYTQDAAGFYTLLDALLPRAAAPWDILDTTPRVHLLLFVHRIAGIAPGLYALPRTPAGQLLMQTAMRDDFSWNRPDACPTHLPLFQLAEARLGQAAKSLHCHQAIAADGTFALAMLAEFDLPLQQAPWQYRQLYWEAGLIGQALYLEAEATGLRGTGIGCFFDDVCHELLGLRDTRLQSLYHFTVGYPLTDDRVLSLPPYPGPR